MVKEDVFEQLKREIIAADGQVNETLLEIKVDGAYQDVKMARAYPSSYSEEYINKDIERYYSNILNIARFDYGNVGAEGQSTYSADGTSIHYLNRDKYFKGVYPIGVIL